MIELDSRQVAPDTWVVSIVGRLIIGSDGPRVQNLISSLFGQGARRVVIDMAGVTHLDSTGIGYLVAAMNDAMNAEADLLLAAATVKTREAFRLTRLDSVFQFFDSVEAATATRR